MNAPAGAQTSSKNNEGSSQHHLSADELTIRINSEHEQPSPLSKN